MAPTRREFLLASSAAFVAEGLPSCQDSKAAPRAARAIKPLPFEPGRLAGLSERLIRSHHENNYTGAVRNLEKVTADLARLPKDAPPYLVGGLKERELMFVNSAILHEHYFGNLGGDGRAAGEIERALAARWGTFARWEEEFRMAAQSLAGGSGWVVLAYDLDTGAPRICWSGNHTQALAAGVPLLVLDMYEHAYHLDYGAAAMKYVDAFFTNVSWEAVDRRFARGVKAAAAPHG